MPTKRIFVLVIYVLLTYTIAHAGPMETHLNDWYYTQKTGKYHASFLEKSPKNIHLPEDSIAFQGSMRPYRQEITGRNTLSIGGVSAGFHTELGTDAPFFGVFGYHRQPVTFTHTGQPQTVNLGWLGSVEYTDASWGGSFLGIDTQIDAEIFLVSGMVGTDFQTPSGVLTAGAGFAFHAMTLGVGVELFGISSSSSEEYSGFTPTALIAYTFHTVSGGIAESAATFYARYQGEGFMVGVSLGLISFK